MESQDAAIFLVFTLAAIIHVPFSCGLHLFLPLRYSIYNLWWKYDLTGIFVQGVFLCFTNTYFVFAWWGCLLNTLVGLCILAFAIPSVIARGEEGGDINLAGNAKMVAPLVAGYIFPLLYSAARDIKNGQPNSTSVIFGLLSPLVCAAGTIPYATYWPEKLFPGKFTKILPTSHNIMHLGVNLLYICEFFCLLDNYNRFGTL